MNFYPVWHEVQSPDEAVEFVERKLAEQGRRLGRIDKWRILWEYRWNYSRMKRKYPQGGKLYVSSYVVPDHDR